MIFGYPLVVTNRQFAMENQTPIFKNGKPSMIFGYPLVLTNRQFAMENQTPIFKNGKPIYFYGRFSMANC